MLDLLLYVLASTSALWAVATVYSRGWCLLNGISVEESTDPTGEYIRTTLSGREELQLSKLFVFSMTIHVLGVKAVRYIIDLFDRLLGWAGPLLMKLMKFLMTVPGRIWGIINNLFGVVGGKSRNKWWKALGFFAIAMIFLSMVMTGFALKEVFTGEASFMEARGALTFLVGALLNGGLIGFMHKFWEQIHSGKLARAFLLLMVNCLLAFASMIASISSLTISGATLDRNELLDLYGGRAKLEQLVEDQVVAPSRKLISISTAAYAVVDVEGASAQVQTELESIDRDLAEVNRKIDEAKAELDKPIPKNRSVQLRFDRYKVAMAEYTTQKDALNKRRLELSGLQSTASRGPVIEKAQVNNATLDRLLTQLGDRNAKPVEPTALTSAFAKAKESAIRLTPAGTELPELGLKVTTLLTDRKQVKVLEKYNLLPAFTRPWTGNQNVKPFFAVLFGVVLDLVPVLLMTCFLLFGVGERYLWPAFIWTIRLLRRWFMVPVRIASILLKFLKWPFLAIERFINTKLSNFDSTL